MEYWGRPHIIITRIVYLILILQPKINIRSEDVTVQVKKLVVRAREEQGKTWNQISIDYNLPIRTARDIGGFYFILWFLLFYVLCCFYKKIINASDRRTYLSSCILARIFLYIWVRHLLPLIYFKCCILLSLGKLVKRLLNSCQNSAKVKLS